MGWVDSSATTLARLGLFIAAASIAVLTAGHARRLWRVFLWLGLALGAALVVWADLLRS
jgi:hypothetical protein